MILSGDKTTTWRLFDDKDLRVGDLFFCRNKETLEDICKAKITSCTEKELGKVTDDDYEGHGGIRVLKTCLRTLKATMVTK